MTLVHSARHQIVSGALRRGFDQDRRFDLGKSVFIEIVSDQLCHLMAESEILLHLQLAQVQISVFQSQVVVYFIVVLDVDRWCLRLGIHGQRCCENLDIAGGKIRVLGRSFANRAFDADAVFAAQALSRREDVFRNSIVKSDLNDSCFVSEIRENQAAQGSLDRKSVV